VAVVPADRLPLGALSLDDGAGPERIARAHDATEGRRGAADHGERTGRHSDQGTLGVRAVRVTFRGADAARADGLAGVSVRRLIALPDGVASVATGHGSIDR
jgi:hypothetical protein